MHQRFSTNTFPSWPLAHPYRYVAHNGEINTLRGNINWMKAREGLLKSSVFGDDLQKVLPVITPGRQRHRHLRQRARVPGDGGALAAARGADDDPGAVGAAIPAMDPAVRAFYEYHSSLMEPWDGPASITFTDGTLIGAVLDRNGLRPSRYCITKDDLVIMASEVGVLDIPADRVVVKDRLRPGKMLLIDTGAGPHHQRRRDQADAWPPSIRTASGCGSTSSTSRTCRARSRERPDHQTVLRRQQAFGYTQEDLRMLLTPMALNGEEPIGSMGTDTALAVLSDKPRLLYDYFKQLFAQVTNPPLDAIREELVTSMGVDHRPGRQPARSRGPRRAGRSRSTSRCCTTTRSPSSATCRRARRSDRRRCRCCTTRMKTARASSARWRSCAARRARRWPPATAS